MATRKKKPPQFTPISLKEILGGMKKNIDIMFDLAYSAIMFQSKEIANEVIQMDEHIHELTYLLGFQVLNAKTGRFADVRKLEPIIGLGYSFDKMSEALADIAKVTHLNSHLAQFFQLCWKATPEPIIKVTVGKGTPFTGKKWSDVNFMADYGVDTIAIYRAKHWIFDDDTSIQEADQLIVTGELPALTTFKQVCNSEEPISFDLERKQSHDLFKQDDPKVMECVDRLKGLYIRITDLSETMVNLAFASLFFGNIEIAGDVIDLERVVDSLLVDLERNILEFAGLIPVPQNLLGLMRIVYSCELISDAASNVSEHIVKGFEPHEVIVEAFNEAWDIAVREKVARNSFFNNKTVAEVHSPKHAKGFHILAIKRDGDWIYDIKLDCRLQVDDIIIGIGPKEMINAWRKQVNPDAEIEEE